VLDRETRHYREHLGLTFAELVYDGRWFTPLREALWACAEKIAEPISMARSSSASTRAPRPPSSARARTRSTPRRWSFEGEEIYSQKDAGGFIKLLSLPERIRAMKARAIQKTRSIFQDERISMSRCRARRFEYGKHKRRPLAAISNALRSISKLDRFIERISATYRGKLLDGSKRPIENLRAFIATWPKIAASGKNLGCFISNALIETSPSDAEVAARVTRVLRSEEMLLRGVLSEAQERGEWPKTKDAAMVARAIVGLRLSMTMLARLGSLDANVRSATDAALLLLEP
jgi:hypothetical protein